MCGGGKIKYLIQYQPEPDACDRCKRTAYKNGEDETDGYLLYVVESSDFVAHSPIHPPTCRCRAIILGTVEGGEEIEANDADLSAFARFSKSIRAFTGRVRDLLSSPTALGNKKPWEAARLVVNEQANKLLNRIISMFKK